MIMSYVSQNSTYANRTKQNEPVFFMNHKEKPNTCFDSLKKSLYYYNSL